MSAKLTIYVGAVEFTGDQDAVTIIGLRPEPITRSLILSLFGNGTAGTEYDDHPQFWTDSQITSRADIEALTDDQVEELFGEFLDCISVPYASVTACTLDDGPDLSTLAGIISDSYHYRGNDDGLDDPTGPGGVTEVENVAKLFGIEIHD